MQIVTTAEMQAADRATVEQFHVSIAQLMEAAGIAVADFLLQYWPQADRVLIIAGKGNNGGDGLVAARHLMDAGVQVKTLLLAPPSQLKAETASNLDRLMLDPIIVTQVETLEAEEAQAALEWANCIVDSVFGTGFRPPLDEIIAAVKAQLDQRPHTPVLSVDLPTGWDADSREPNAAAAFRSDAVVTFTAPKLAHAFGMLTDGPIVVADIGSPAAAVQCVTGLTCTAASKAMFERKRNRDGNKGQFGHVLVIGGSRGKAGAPSMAALACMRVGAGLTTAAVAAGILPTVARIAPELMTFDLAETADGEIATENAQSARWLQLLEKKSVLAIGPGLGSSPAVRHFVHHVVANTTLPLVLDADGLNAYDDRAGRLSGKDRTLVLTPHPGEMARLLHCTIAQVQADREAIARKFATEHGLILVLKGWRTLVAHPDGRVAVNTTGNPGMAKGGSGDVLTGLIAGMLAQAQTYGATPGQAVEAAVYLHGLAADMAVADGDEHTFLPTDLLDYLPDAFRFRNPQNGVLWLQGFPTEGAE